MIIVVMGLPGTGKSVVAAALGKRLRAPVVRTDMIRRALFRPVGLKRLRNLESKFLYDVQRANVGREITGEARQVMEAQKEVVYNALFLLVEELAGTGKDVVMDATFFRESYRARARAVARRLGQRIFFVQTVCPDEIVKARMSRRNIVNVANARFQTYLQFKKTFEPARGPVLFVDTTHPLRESVDFVLKHIGWRK